jgi:hypothetical protein
LAVLEEPAFLMVLLLRQILPLAVAAAVVLVVAPEAQVVAA